MTDELWEWHSTGGCERCDDMEDRYFQEEPPRQHPNCTCDIVESDELPCEEREPTYQLAHVESIHGPTADPDDTFTMVFDYRITCPTGDVKTGQVEVERTYGELEAAWDDAEEIFFEEAVAEALEEVDGIAAADCPPCPTPAAIV